MTKRIWWTGGFMIAAAAAGGVFVGRAMADGIPATGALTYSGVLEDANGVALTGSKNIQVLLWGAASGGSTAECQSPSAAQTLVGGRFQVALPDACAQAIRAKPDLWVEVIVEGKSLGRTKLGAVPYAVEAQRAVQANELTTAAKALEQFNAAVVDGGAVKLGDVSYPDPKKDLRWGMVFSAASGACAALHPTNAGGQYGMVLPTYGDTCTNTCKAKSANQVCRGGIAIAVNLDDNSLAQGTVAAKFYNYGCENGMASSPIGQNDPGAVANVNPWVFCCCTL
jgi:hypothetical protein